MKQLFTLLLFWPNGPTYTVATDLTIEQCAGRAAMERIADSRWQVRCEVQRNVFRVVKRNG